MFVEAHPAWRLEIASLERQDQRLALLVGTVELVDRRFIGVWIASALILARVFDDSRLT
jgi:hypothetical protein